MQAKKGNLKSGLGTRKPESSPVIDLEKSGPKHETLNKSKWSNGPPLFNAQNSKKKEDSSAKVTEFNSGDISKFMHDRILFLICNMIGSKVSITVRGEKFVGILGFSQSELKITLHFAQKVLDNGKLARSTEVGKPIVLSVSEIRALAAVDVDFSATERVNAVPNGFKTDTSISGHSGSVRERPLTAWKPDKADVATTGSLEDLSGKNSEPWDQFEVNRKLFGVTTDYKEDIYTTIVDKKRSDYIEREKEALRIAGEIENDISDNVHLAEERNQIGQSEGNVDEETRYSSVVRSESLPVRKYVPKPIALEMKKQLLSDDPSILQASVSGELPPRAKIDSETVSKMPNFASVAAGHAAAKVPMPSVEPLQRMSSLKLSSALNKIGSKIAAVPVVPVIKSTKTTIASTALHFREFANSQKAVFELQKAKVTQAEKADTISELKNFSKSLKLAKPMPTDLKELLHKDAPVASGNSSVLGKAKARAPAETEKIASTVSNLSKSPSISSDSLVKPKANPPEKSIPDSKPVVPNPTKAQEAAIAPAEEKKSTKKNFQFNVNASAFEWKSSAAPEKTATGASSALPTSQPSSAPQSIVNEAVPLMPMLPTSRSAVVPVPPPAMVFPNVPAVQGVESGVRDEFLRGVLGSMVEHRRQQKRNAADDSDSTWTFGKYSFNSLLEMATNGDVPAGYDSLRVSPNGGDGAAIHNIAPPPVFSHMGNGGYIDLATGAPIVVAAPPYGFVYSPPNMPFVSDSTGMAVPGSMEASAGIPAPPALIQGGVVHSQGLPRPFIPGPGAPSMVGDDGVPIHATSGPMPGVPGGVFYYTAMPGPGMHDPARFRSIGPYDGTDGAGPGMGYVVPAGQAPFYSRTVIGAPQVVAAGSPMYAPNFPVGDTGSYKYRESGRNFNRNSSNAAVPVPATDSSVRNADSSDKDEVLARTSSPSVPRELASDTQSQQLVGNNSRHPLGSAGRGRDRKNGPPMLPLSPSTNNADSSGRSSYKNRSSSYNYQNGTPQTSVNTANNGNGSGYFKSNGGSSTTSNAPGNRKFYGSNGQSSTGNSNSYRKRT